MTVTKKKTDREQLRGILKEFDIRDASAALDEMRGSLMPSPTGFDNQGPECSHGQDGCVGREAFESGELEAVWGQDNLIPAHFLSEGAQVQKAVAMVTLKNSYSGLPAGNGWGSGFLVSDSLFMTNNHVIGSTSFCDKVNMQFMYQDNYDSQPAIASEFFETNEDSFFHTNAALDYTIVRLKRKPSLFINKYAAVARGYNVYRLNKGEHGETTGIQEEYADEEQIVELRSLSDVIAKKSPLASIDLSRLLQILGYTPGSKYGSLQLRPTVSYPVGLRLNVIQHPQGRKKEVVVQQNELKDVHTNVIHYYSDTDYGSSGSPVFDNSWNLMALHHARDNAEQANEGMRIDKIVADLRNEFQASNPGILTELGI